MHVSYGPPGHRGVTHLMAIGDVELACAQPAITHAALLSVAIAGLGLLVGSSTLRTAGIGGALAVMWLSRELKKPRIVEITKPL